MSRERKSDLTCVPITWSLSQRSKEQPRSAGSRPSCSGSRLSCTPSLSSRIRSPSLQGEVKVDRLRRSGAPPRPHGPSRPPQSAGLKSPPRLAPVSGITQPVSFSIRYALQSPTLAHTKPNELSSREPKCASSMIMPASSVVVPASSVPSKIFFCASEKDSSRKWHASCTSRMLFMFSRRKSITRLHARRAASFGRYPQLQPSAMAKSARFS
mmetsp:Transcript_16544/g.42348  ORF Transcript_16544/g.42348 Transcript_16544/m.42348 type:complete len:212 (-) Transcript_16544:827-1462(-)